MNRLLTLLLSIVTGLLVIGLAMGFTIERRELLDYKSTIQVDINLLFTLSWKDCQTLAQGAPVSDATRNLAQNLWAAQTISNLVRDSVVPDDWKIVHLALVGGSADLNDLLSADTGGPIPRTESETITHICRMVESTTKAMSIYEDGGQGQSDWRIASHQAGDAARNYLLFREKRGK